MELHRIVLSRDQLNAIPENERTMLILFCHAMNELAVLIKVFHWASIHKSNSDAETKGSNSMVLTFARLICGKIFECWELIRKSYFGSAVAKDYHPKLDDASKEAFASLSAYFKKRSVITTIRNQYAFHYAPDQLTKAYEKLPEYEDDLELFLADSNLATFYSFADILTNGAMLTDVAEAAELDAEDPAVALNQIREDTVKLIGLLNQALSGCISVAIQEHLGESLEELGAETIELEGLIGQNDLSLPYFIEDAYPDGN